MKFNLTIWRLLHNFKLTVKILSIFVAFLENMNFNTFLEKVSKLVNSHGSKVCGYNKCKENSPRVHCENI